MNKHYKRLSAAYRKHRGLIIAHFLALVLGIGWWREWPWSRWVLIGAAISAVGEFAPTTGRFSISTAVSRRLVLVGVLLTIGAGLKDNQESETSAKELSDNVEANLELTRETLASVDSSIARQEELMNTMVGSNSVFYLHPETNEVGEPVIYSRFDGEYPIPHIYFEIRDFSSLGIGFMDAHKTSVCYSKSLNHVYKNVLWRDACPSLYDNEYGIMRIDYEEGHRAFTQFVLRSNFLFCYRLYEKTPSGLIHLAEYDFTDPELEASSVAAFDQDVALVTGHRLLPSPENESPGESPTE